MPRGRPKKTDVQKAESSITKEQEKFRILSIWLDKLSGEVYSGNRIRSKEERVWLTHEDRFEFYIPSKFAYIFDKFFTYQEHGILFISTNFKLEKTSVAGNKNKLGAFTKRVIVVVKSLKEKGKL